MAGEASALQDALTPMSSSWFNLDKRFVALLTGDVIHDCSFTSVNELMREYQGLCCRGKR
jgi:hypothetical protein